MSYAPAADSVLQILLLLARQATPVPAGLISAALGLPRSTTYRLLGVLVEQGLAVYLPEERRYGVGVVAYEIGSAYQRQVRCAGSPSRLEPARYADPGKCASRGAARAGRVLRDRGAGATPLTTGLRCRRPAARHRDRLRLAILAGLSNKQVRAVFPHPRDLVQRDGMGQAR